MQLPEKREVKKQAFRIHASFLLLALGLLLSRLYYGTWRGSGELGAAMNPHVMFMVWTPSVVGAFGLYAWTLRMTLFKGKDIDSLPGSIALGLMLVALALVIAGALP